MLLRLFSIIPVLLFSVLSSAAERHNVVVIVADDLGYGETGMMGNRQIPTPNIDALAATGVRCTDGYVTASYCSPSRAAIITGRYQSRFGYDSNPTGSKNLLPDAGLPDEEVTSCKDFGMPATKPGWWESGTSGAHLQSTHYAVASIPFTGFLHEGHFYVPGPPYKNVHSMVRDTSLEKGERAREGNFIRGNYTRMNEPPYDRDNPLMRGTETIEEPRYLTDAIGDEATEFINKHHESPFCLMVCFNAVHSPMQALDDDVQTLQRIEDIQRRIFAGMVLSLDRAIGKISTAIDEHRLRRKTLVVFISDNGGPTAELTSSNAPLRGGKGTLYEGGIRVPMVWSMPGTLPEGRTESRVVTSLDIAATALEMAGLEPDPKADGVSMFSWIDDPIATPNVDVFWRMPGGRAALRSGNWKIIRPRDSRRFELYHLKSDLGEARDLSGVQSTKLSEMINRWQAFNAEMASE